MEHMPAQGGTIPMQRPCIVEDCPANGGCPLDGLLPGWLGWLAGGWGTGQHGSPLRPRHPEHDQQP